MSRLLSLLLFPAIAGATDFTLFSGTQGGGALDHIASGGTLSIAQAPVHGLILGLPIDSEREYELFYSRQLTRLQEGAVAVPAQELIDLDIHYLHLGGTVLSEPWHDWQGFLSGGLGVTYFSPSLSGAGPETRPSMSYGLGARWMPTPRLGLRLEARLLGSLFNSNTRVFCSGGCAFSIDGDLLTQYAVMGGVVVRLD